LKILVLTFYFRPDLSACSFRATPLVGALRAVMPEGSQIDVVTTLPNRYASFSAEAPCNEVQDGISIYRIPLSAHKSGMADQAMAFLSYGREVFNFVRSRDYDLVFATSSRLMTAALAACVARRKNIALYLDIRDIFVDTIKDVLSRRIAWAAKPAFSLLERWTVNRADRVNLVSEGFAGYFASRYPNKHFTYFTNGIDDEFLTAAPADTGPALRKSGPVSVICAGNIGEGQGLHLIIPELAKRMTGKVHFKVIGDGGRKEVLRKALSAAGVDNVELLPPIQRDRLIEAYRAADALFLHLNDYDAFKKVLPSKLFEYAATGKPIWAGLAGYSAKFVRSEISNAAIFDPCDAHAAEQALSKLVFEDTPRKEFIRKYARSNISRMMAQDIVAVKRGGGKICGSL